MEGGKLEVRKVHDVRNLANHLTKVKSGVEMAVMIRGAGGEVVWRQEQKRRSS